jgi:flagellar basal-body rod modification protein FlgD
MPIDFSVTPPVGSNTGANKSTGSKTQVDYQSFLKLLMAQMKNQDPTKPMESTEYVAQLATFSQVEQSVQMNARLDQILQSSALAQADALIGRKDGVTAVLSDGKTVAVVTGVKVKAAA